ncbi:MAG: hypothetical protein E7022_08870 [Desulfovibrio desulfuricans]|nr:hypothetical protein [Desulfovibrio desulfuricans]
MVIIEKVNLSCAGAIRRIKDTNSPLSHAADVLRTRQIPSARINPFLPVSLFWSGIGNEKGTYGLYSISA